MSTTHDVAILSKVAPLLNDKDQGFALSLVEQFRTRGSLSPKQFAWVAELTQRAMNGEPEATDLGNIKGVIELLETAAKHLKFPKLLLRIDNAGLGVSYDIRLSLAGPNSKSPGTVQVASPGAFEFRTWYGRITRDGKFEPSPRVESDTLTAVAAGLKALAADPAKVAADYGKLTGHCCFCTLPLSDPRSVKVGYGKICADHFGLPWGSK